MPSQIENTQNHSEEVNEIITAVPSWIIRRGIFLILVIILAIFFLSALISYPDIVKTTLKINSLNSPKIAIAGNTGKLIKILVVENQHVVAQQPLAFLESTGSHQEVINLAKKLNVVSKLLNADQPITNEYFAPTNLDIGELQGNYQIYYQAYLQFMNTQNGGLYLIQKKYLLQDLNEIQKLRIQINQQKIIKEQEFENAKEEYIAYQKLKNKNVISNAEFRLQENKYLASKYPLEQTSTDLLNNNSSYMNKQKEIATLDITIKEEQSKFRQALNTMINEANSWLMRYVVFSPSIGKVGYIGILQENQNVVTNQDLFTINPGNTDFFGEVRIPQYNMGKVNVGQRVLIKMRSYPYEEFGIINGKISYIKDFAVRDSIFVAKIDFQKNQKEAGVSNIVLKEGMTADAEIITKESSLLQRFFWNTTKIFK